MRPDGQQLIPWHSAGHLLIAFSIAIATVTGCTADPESSDADDQQTQAAAGSVAASTSVQSTKQSVSPIRFLARRESSGIDVDHCSGISDERYFPALNGSGIAATDFDQDGWTDLIFVTACPIPIPDESSTFITRVFRNLGGWQFREVTAVAGGQFDGFVAGITAADFDNDGFADFYLNCLGQNRLYHNQGDGSYRLLQGDNLPVPQGFGTSSAFADLDGDSALDLFVCNYGDWSPETNKWCGDRVTGIRAYCAPDEIDPAIDTIYRSNGDGTFTDRTEDCVVKDRNFRSQGVIATHLNSDHLIDLYIGNDAHPNCLYINKGNFMFDEVAQTTGAAFDRNGALQASMGIAAADFDRNSSMDLFVTNYSREHNALYRGLGNGVFMDEARATGVMDGAMPLVGWGVGFADFDTDGWEDLIVVNGHTDMNLQLTGEESDYKQPTLVYRNSEGRFVLLNNCIENEAESIGSSRGLAMLDADGDLDVDIVFTNQDAQPGVFENTSAHVQECTAVRLIGTSGNRDAIGATVTISTEPPVVRVVQGGGSYLSTSSSTIYLPITTDSDARVTITWPGGMQSIIDGLTADATWVILEPQTPAAPARTIPLPIPVTR